MGKGEARSLGSMACGFVDAQAMGRMLGKKYPKAFDDRKRTMQVQRSFAKDYNQFVREQERMRIDAQNAKLDNYRQPVSSGLIQISGDLALVATINSDDDFLGNEILFTDELLLPDDVEEMRWNQQDFTVKDTDKFGNNVIGLDLRDNDQLYQEWTETRDYLQHDGLDINLMKDKPGGKFEFRPHVSFFETCGPAGRVALSAFAYMPDTIPLHSPWLHVNPN